MEFLNKLTTTLDLLLAPFLRLPPALAIFLLSFFISLLTTVVYKISTNQKLMKDLKDEIKTLQQQARDLKDNPEKAMDVQKKSMETNMKYMSHSMRPTFITFLPLIFLFGWMRTHFTETEIIIPFINWNIGWLGAYILFSILFSIILRKVLKVY